jgi:hypothetical protein
MVGHHLLDRVIVGARVDGSALPEEGNAPRPPRRAAVKKPANPWRAACQRSAHGAAEGSPEPSELNRIADGGNERHAVDAMLSHLRKQPIDWLEAWVEMVVRVDETRHEFSNRSD